MKTGQGFLLVFSITSQSSLSELGELREQIIRIKDDENVPIVIVGNKSDLEEDRVVSRQKAFSVSQSWGNAPYYETSARRRGEFSFLFFFYHRWKSGILTELKRMSMRFSSISADR